jgi:hypothetical protein
MLQLRSGAGARATLLAACHKSQLKFLRSISEITNYLQSIKILETETEISCIATSISLRLRRRLLMGEIKQFNYK